MLLDSIRYVLFLMASVSVFVVAGIYRVRWARRRSPPAAREGHRRAKLHLHEAMRTGPGAQLVVQRVISSSLRGTRAVVRWTSTWTEYNLWFARAYPQAGDCLAIAGADPSAGRVDVPDVLTRVMVHSFDES